MTSFVGQLYGLAMALRRRLYQSGHKQVYRPPCPCISVGNIAWGGTGKTPLTSWILSFAAQNGRLPVVLSRGYKGHPPVLPYLVDELSDAGLAGDEPLMLARQHTTARVVVDPKRARAAAWAWERFKPDLFVLDDGFQHVGVGRDLDLVLLRPDDLGRRWDAVLSGWREGQDALAWADAFLIKAGPAEFDRLTSLLHRRLTAFEKPVFSFALEAEGLIRVADKEFIPKKELILQKGYVLVSAVAEPGQVKDTAAQLTGRLPEEHVVFSDHHAFAQKDWARISSIANRKKAPFILCTAKDAVKLEKWADSRLHYIKIQPVFGPVWPAGTASFEQCWAKAWKNLPWTRPEGRHDLP